MDENADTPVVAPASRRWAQGAFLLAVTSLLLAWWRITWSGGGPPVRDEVRLFQPEVPLTTSWGPWLTGILVLGAIALLFVRIAARSDKHEPPVWRRDLRICAVLLGLALVSCLLWPADVPSFWGGRTYVEDNVTTEITETTMPGLGWWVAAVALLCAAVARGLSGQAPTAPPTTDK